MDFHDKEFFNRLMMLTEDNHKILRRMQRSARISSVFKIVYWIVIIGISIGAFYFIKPYTDQIFSFYQNYSSNINTLQKAFGSTPNPKQ